jgi:uncharacterized protein (TIGR03435 family)
MRALIAVLLFAAQGPLAFEVASVKVNKSGDFRKQIGPAPGGRFLATNNTLRDLIPYAYGLPQVQAGFRIVGAPKWIDEDRFDITASTTGTWTPQQMSEMLRTLLADRFKLVTHRETREMATYALVTATPGAKLRRSEIDQAACDARRAAIQRRENVAPIPAGAKPVCPTGRTMPGSVTAVGGTLEGLAATLAPFVNRVVTNRTELAGLFDFELTWTPDQPAQAPPDATPIAIDPNGPSIFTALQEQLGLKLESTRGPVDVVVIDRVERPMED